ncbi:Hypothetical protein GSB_151356 [Giardia duodenalis]|uniref:Uncharacterized protein n=2 Tax=Giardia intestinalis TaxID=5741 RepID=C6LWW3_GIAIB|nr:Hypothetical protein GL50581_3277 [Giardia intestinalis ATCC 50581]ESU45664.1 Hypothetical protein GSB_151356 [Giardia intestinalis]
MTNVLAAVKTLNIIFRGYLQRLTFQRISFCISELLRIPQTVRLVDSHATEDVHLILKLQGPEFPPRVVYAFTSNKEYYQVLMDPTMLCGASFQTSGASSRYRGEAAMTRSFVQRTHAIVKYKELFSYDRQNRRYVSAVAVSPDSPSHLLLEQALLRCNRRTTPRRSLPSVKAMRARQLRMMFGLSRISEVSGGTSRESSIIKAPYQSEHACDLLDASLLEFCNQTGIAPAHWSALSTPDVHLDFDVRSPAHRSPEGSSPPMVDIARVSPQDSSFHDDGTETTFNNVVIGSLYPQKQVFLTEKTDQSTEFSHHKSHQPPFSPIAQTDSELVHFVTTTTSDVPAVPKHTPTHAILTITPQTPDEIIDAFFSTGNKQEAQTILNDIGSLEELLI